MDFFIYSAIIVFAAFLFYAVIPTVYIRRTGIGITKKVNGKSGVALSFDDGPNPEYTPQLLDLLKMYGITATFFVVGCKAEKYPEIIQRMHKEGHAIGIHHFNHISAWTLSPNKLREQLELTEKIIYEYTKEPVRFYRPPWGHFNLFTPFVAKKYKVIMWSNIYGDWKINNCKTRLLRQLNDTQENGAVVLLHDCGETPGADHDAPRYMIEKLALYLEGAAKKGTQFIPPDELLSQ